jgi:hypothetical protein
MRLALICASFASLLAVPAAALAQAPAASVEVKKGVVIYTSDGTRLGHVYSVRKGEDGKPVEASVIYRSRMIYIPVSTLTAGEKGLVTARTRTELAAR